tara:strand:+ start:713 stop:1015 length:303 start_codon:yes stop_codon:yes gene_type:complete
MKQHLQRYIGWYFLAASLGLIMGGEYFTGFLIALVTLLKVPPFDWVGRAMDWAAGIGVKWGLKMRSWKEKQNKPIRVLVTIVAIILILLIWWFMPECELC